MGQYNDSKPSYNRLQAFHLCTAPSLFPPRLSLPSYLTGVVCVHVHILCSKVSPLEAVDWPQVPLLSVAQALPVQELTAAVAVPDVNPLGLKLLGRSGTTNKPEQLLQNTWK